MEPLVVKNLSTKLMIGKNIHTVVDDVSFTLEAGKILALVGETGSGKSMTALSLLQIIPKPPLHSYSGEVLFQGQNLLSLSSKQLRKIRGRSISMIFQDPLSALNPVYTIGEQMIEVSYHHLKMNVKEAKMRALHLLEEVGLPDPASLFSRYPHQLSGGMLQRAMIAMALLLEPSVLIADEPTTALDVTIQKQILELLQELQKKKNMATLIITHDMGVVAEIADDVIVMYAGQKIEEASAPSLFDSPSHPYTQALFSTYLGPNLQRGKLPTIAGTVPSLGHYPKGCRFAPRCPYVMDACKAEVPPLFSLPQKEHLARCLLFDEHLEGRLEDL